MMEITAICDRCGERAEGQKSNFGTFTTPNGWGYFSVQAPLFSSDDKYHASFCSVCLEDFKRDFMKQQPRTAKTERDTILVRKPDPGVPTCDLLGVLSDPNVKTNQS